MQEIGDEPNVRFTKPFIVRMKLPPPPRASRLTLGLYAALVVALAGSLAACDMQPSSSVSPSEAVPTIADAYAVIGTLDLDAMSARMDAVRRVKGARATQADYLGALTLQERRAFERFAKIVTVYNADVFHGEYGGSYDALLRGTNGLETLHAMGAVACSGSASAASAWEEEMEGVNPCRLECASFAIAAIGLAAAVTGGPLTIAAAMASWLLAGEQLGRCFELNGMTQCIGGSP